VTLGLRFRLKTTVTQSNTYNYGVVLGSDVFFKKTSNTWKAILDFWYFVRVSFFHLFLYVLSLARWVKLFFFFLRNLGIEIILLKSFAKVNSRTVGL